MGKIPLTSLRIKANVFKNGNKKTGDRCKENVSISFKLSIVVTALQTLS